MRLMLMGSRPVFAPEDQGAEFDDADADDLETPEAGGEDDEPLDEDAELDADEPTDLEDEALAAEPEARPAKRGASEEIRALRARAQEAERRAEAAEQAAASRRNEEAQRAEQERLANMEPAERVEHVVNQRLARIEFQSWDSNDRVAFEAKAAGNPALSRIKDEVEETFRSQVASGKPIDRQTIAAFLIGQKALAAAPRARAAGARSAAAGKERNAARPASGRGDVARSPGRSTDTVAARRARLEGLDI